MPELPDVNVYVERLRHFVVGEVLLSCDIRSPFLLRTVEPPINEYLHKRVTTVSRLGKRIVFGFDEGLFMVIHLMIAGRLRWRELGRKPPRGANVLAQLAFTPGSLWLTEASKKRRASMHLVLGESGLEEFRRGGLELLDCSPEAFIAAIQRENHTLKRALTDPRILSGVGNAYSDEILFRAKLSPFKQTRNLNAQELERLHGATQWVLRSWLERIREETGAGFPEKVTAFRKGMAVHGRYREPCPDCGASIQRIVYAENEANYCAGCQTGGRLLADRALSRLLKANWPRRLEDLEGK